MTQTTNVVDTTPASSPARTRNHLSGSGPRPTVPRVSSEKSKEKRRSYPRSLVTNPPSRPSSLEVDESPPELPQTPVETSVTTSGSCPTRTLDPDYKPDHTPVTLSFSRDLNPFPGFSRTRLLLFTFPVADDTCVYTCVCSCIYVHGGVGSFVR